MFGAAWALTLALAGPDIPIDVAASVACPTADEVAGRLRPLLGPAGLGKTGDRVQLDRQEGALRVALVNADGQVRASRNVDDRHDCGELAEAAAVILASWQPQDDRVVQALAGELHRPAPVAVARVAPAASVTTASVDPARPAGLTLAIGGGVSVTGDGAVPLAALEADLVPARGDLSLRLRAAVTGMHDRPITGTEARVGWRRIPLALGPAWTWRSADGGTAFSFDLAPAVAWLSMAGEGFMDNGRQDVTDVGGTLGLRFGWPRPSLRPWIGLTGWYWPQRTIARAVSDDARTVVPRVEVSLTLGFSFGGPR